MRVTHQGNAHRPSTTLRCLLSTPAACPRVGQCAARVMRATCALLGGIATPPAQRGLPFDEPLEPSECLEDPLRGGVGTLGAPPQPACTAAGAGAAAAGCAALRGGGGGTPEPSSTDASWRGLGARGGRATPTRGLPVPPMGCPRTASPCSRIDCIARRSVDLLMRAASCALVSSKRGAAAPGANLLTRGARPRRSLAAEPGFDCTGGRHAR
jgi:hypothetical protein